VSSGSGALSWIIDQAGQQQEEERPARFVFGAAGRRLYDPCMTTAPSGVHTNHACSARFFKPQFKKLENDPGHRDVACEAISKGPPERRKNHLPSWVW